MRTIWSPEALSHIESSQRFQVLYLFPVIYAVNALTYLAFGTVNGGSKVMRAAFGIEGTLALNLLIGLAAAVAAAGLIFMWHQVERWAAIVMVSGVVCYLILLFFALGAGNSPVSTISGSVVSALLIGTRVRQIAKDIGRSRALS